MSFTSWSEAESDDDEEEEEDGGRFALRVRRVPHLMADHEGGDGDGEDDDDEDDDGNDRDDGEDRDHDDDSDNSTGGDGEEVEDDDDGYDEYAEKLPWEEALDPMQHPKDYVAAVLFELICREVLYVIDSHALATSHEATTSSLSLSEDGIYHAALSVVHALANSVSYRHILTTSLFRPLMAVAGLRANVIARQALTK